jgi:hypothetical protein
LHETSGNRSKRELVPLILLRGFVGQLEPAYERSLLHHRAHVKVRAARFELSFQEAKMKKSCAFLAAVFLCVATWFTSASAQDRKPERIRIGGGGVGAPQMTMWFAKEANLYEKHGLAVEAIHIPGSSLALQAMLSGEVLIIQLGGTASIQANLAGADCQAGGFYRPTLGPRTGRERIYGSLIA